MGLNEIEPDPSPISGPLAVLMVIVGCIVLAFILGHGLKPR